MLKDYLITVLGLICFIEGLPWLAIPDRWKRLTLMIISVDSRVARILGGLLMVLGLLLVYWGRTHGG